MKTFKLLLPIVPSLVLLAGCDGGGSGAAQPQSTNPADVNNPLVNAKRTADKTIDVSFVNQAIQLFNVEKGRNPKDLDELVQQKFIPQVPAAPYGYKLVYDAGSGKVSVVKE